MEDYKYIIEPKAINRITSFYKKAYKAHPNTSSYDDIVRNVQKTFKSAHQIEKSLLRRKAALPKWKRKKYYMATDYNWYFAYVIKGDTIYVMDACYHSNMINPIWEQILRRRIMEELRECFKHILIKNR